jgi:hypothetical protein
MWIPTKLDFLFYDFLQFTIIFQRFSQNKYKRKKEKPPREIAREVICPV